MCFAYGYEIFLTIYQRSCSYVYFYRCDPNESILKLERNSGLACCIPPLPASSPKWSPSCCPACLPCNTPRTRTQVLLRGMEELQPRLNCCTKLLPQAYLSISLFTNFKNHPHKWAVELPVEWPAPANLLPCGAGIPYGIGSWLLDFPFSTLFVA